MTKFGVDFIDVEKLNNIEGFDEEWDVDEIANYPLEEVAELIDTLDEEGCLFYHEGFDTLEDAINFLNKKFISKTFIEDVEVQLAEQGFYYFNDVIVITFEDTEN